MGPRRGVYGALAGRLTAERPLVDWLVYGGDSRISDHDLCEDLDVLRRRLKNLAREVERKLDDHELGKLLMSIEGLGPLTAACLIAELGDPARSNRVRDASRKGRRSR